MRSRGIARGADGCRGVLLSQLATVPSVMLSPMLGTTMVITSPCEEKLRYHAGRAIGLSHSVCVKGGGEGKNERLSKSKPVLLLARKTENGTFLNNNKSVHRDDAALARTLREPSQCQHCLAMHRERVLRLDDSRLRRPRLAERM
jgi:hypothetical protein